VSIVRSTLSVPLAFPSPSKAPRIEPSAESLPLVLLPEKLSPQEPSDPIVNDPPILTGKSGKVSPGISVHVKSIVKLTLVRLATSPATSKPIGLPCDVVPA
jgi:hypothetical protein